MASASSRRVLPKKENCLLDSEKGSSDAPRRRPASICSALGGGSVDAIISTLRAEKRTTSGMGLREQEQVQNFPLTCQLLLFSSPTNTRFFDIIAYG